MVKLNKFIWWIHNSKLSWLFEIFYLTKSVDFPSDTFWNFVKKPFLNVTGKVTHSIKKMNILTVNFEKKKIILSNFLAICKLSTLRTEFYIELRTKLNSVVLCNVCCNLRPNFQNYWFMEAALDWSKLGILEIFSMLQNHLVWKMICISTPCPVFIFSLKGYENGRL